MLRQTLTLLTSFILMLGIGVFAVMYQVSAAASPTINYQGKLTDTAGVAVADGDYNMRFYLYNATGGATTTAIWTEELTSTDKVTITNGLFSVMLGSTTALTSVNFNQALYLGVEIGGSTTPAWDGEMSPRKELGTVPAAFEAFQLGGVASSSFLRSDADDTASGLLTFAGGFNSTASSTISGLSFGTATGTTLNINGESFTDFTGTGLTNTSGVLSVSSSSLNLTLEGLEDVADMTKNFGDLLYWTGSAWSDLATSSLNVNVGDTTGTLADGRFVKTGDWTGTFDGQEGTYYLDLANATGDTDDITEGATNLFNQTHTGDVTGATTLSIASDVVAFGDVDYSLTLAGNPALLVDECYFAKTTTGGGFICEGSTADTNEQLYKFPDLNGADTTDTFSTLGATQTFTGVKTISSNWVNTANPWADNEVANVLTVAGGTLGSNSISSASTWTTLGTLTVGDGGDRIDISSNTWDVTNGVITNATWNGAAIGDAYLTKTGDWTGTFDGQEGTYYLDLANATGDTDDITEGATNQYWTNNRFDTRLTATTSLANLATLAGLTTVGTIGTGVWQGSVIDSTYLDTNVLLDTELSNSSQLAGLLSDETGTGFAVFSTNPLLSGFRSNASSTIGDGTATGGLTVSGYSTTTGNAYFAGLVGIGSNDPSAKLTLTGTAGQSNNLFSAASSTISASSSAGSAQGLYSSIDSLGKTTITGRVLNPVEVGSVTDGGTAKAVAISGNYAYVADWTDGLEIIDISDPANPIEVGSVDDGGGASRVIISGNYAYVADGSDGLEIIDISDPTNPVEVGSVDDGGFAYAVAISGNYAYVADWSDGLEIIDISDPTNPVEVGSVYDGGFAYGVVISDNYAYVADDERGLEIIDISDPTNPVKVGSLDDGGNANGIAISGNYAYVADYDDGLEIIDISDPANPVEVGSVDDGGTAYKVTVSGNYAYVADRIDGLEIIDISDPTNPVEVGSVYDASGSTYAVAISGNYAYVADGTDGLEIIDIGALEAANLYAGNILTDQLQVSQTAIFDEAIKVRGSANIGQSLFAQTGSFSKFSTTSANYFALSAALTDGNNSGITDILNLTHSASSTGADGIGAGLLFSLETDAGSATSSSRIASILTDASTSTPASALTFSNKNTAGALTEYMRLTATGYLGLGTTTPGAKFTVQGTAGDSSNLFTLASSTGGSLFTVSSNGNVGIGSTTPNQTLSVDGSFSLSGALYDSTYNAGTNGMILQTTGTGVEWVSSTTLAVSPTASIYPVWAEEVAALNASTNEWSFGNGDETPAGEGIKMVFASNLVGLGLQISEGTATVEVEKNGTLTGKQVVISSGTSNYATFTGGGIVNFAPGDIINFRTIASTGNTNGGRVTAWFTPVDVSTDLAAGTQGSVTFLDSLGNLAEDNANFFWDDVNNRLGIGGTTSPYASLSVNGDLALTGGIYDNAASLGTNGMILQTDGTGVNWVATSSLGIDGSADDLTDDSIETLSDVAAMTRNFGDLFYWNGSAWSDLATSSLNVNVGDTTGTLADGRFVKTGDWTGTFDGQEGSYYLSLANATGNTDNITEGATNLYWTNNRFDARLAATTTLPNLATLAGLTTVGTIGTGVWQGTAIGDAYLTKTGDWTGTFDGQEGSYYLSLANATGNTDNITEGATNLYWTNNRFDARLAATTTLPNLATLAGLTTVGTIGTGVWQGTAIGDAYLTKTGDWTGTFDGQEGSYYLSLANATGNTDNITEGATNLYWTNNRFDARLAATTTLPNLATLAGLTTVGTIGTGVWQGTAIGDAYLTKTGDWTGTFDGQEGTYYLDLANATGDTDDITEGATNLYWTNNRFDARLAATTTLPNLATLAGLTTVGTIGTGVWQGSVIDSTYLDTNVLLDSELSNSSQLAGLLSDETGTGFAVFSTNPLLNGFRSNASSTIGDGTAAGGLTISGYSTTTGNAYFAGLVGIGTSSPSALLTLEGTAGQANNLFSAASSTISASSSAGSAQGLYSSIDSLGKTTITGRVLNPVEVGSVDDGGNARGVAISGNYAYVADSGDGLEIIDISDPTNPVEVGSLDDGGNAYAVAISGNYAYVADWSDGLEIIDISDPTNPVEVGSVDDGGFATGVAISGNYAYVADYDDGLEIIDISDPTNPVEVGSVDDGENAFAVAISGNYAYVGDGNDGLEIIDISDPTNPVEVGSVDDGGFATGVAISGNYAYVADYDDGLEIIDISDPTNPVEVGSVDDGGFAYAVAISGNYAYVADDADGLEIIDISDPATPVEVGSLDDGGNARGVAISGNYAYVADNTDGLEIIDIGALETANLYAGNILTDQLQVSQTAIFDEAIKVRGSANIGQSLFAQTGSFSKFSTTSANYFALSAALTDGNNSGITDILNLTHSASSTGADGIGAGLLFSLETDAGSATSSSRIASILTDASTSTPASALTFSNKNTAGALTEYMRLTASGYLGLGTTTPGAKFTIQGTAGDSSNLFTLASSTGETLLSVSSRGALELYQIDPVLVGSVDTVGGAVGVMTIGNYSYIADGNEGLVIVDVSDPSNPLTVGSVDDGGSAKEVVVVGNYAYVADFADGLEIIDISDPSNPAEVGSHDSGGSYVGVVVQGSYAYIAKQTNGLEIIDISDPTNPVEVGTYDTAGSSFGVAVSGNYAYVADASTGLRIIDISDPTAPVETGVFNTSGASQKVAISGHYAYVADGSGGLSIIDIASSTLPVEMGSFNTAGTANGVVVSGNYAYIADSASGTLVMDISSSTNPVKVGEFYSGTGSAEGVSVSGNYAYIADDTDGLEIIHLGGITAPTAEIGTLLANRIDTNVIYADTSYISSGLNVGQNAMIGGDLAVRGALDIKGANEPVEVGSLDTTAANVVTVSGDIAYVADGSAGLKIIDISDKSNPVLLGSLDDGGVASEVKISGDYAYVADYTDGLEIIDISDPTNPVEVGSFYNGTGAARNVFISGNLAYVADSSAGLEIIDISDPTNPVELGSANDVNGAAYEVVVSGNYAYMADDGDGLEIIDISDPTNPVELINLDDGGNARGVAVSGNYAYVADGTDGLEIIDISDPSAPVEVGSLPITFSAYGVSVSGDYAYVSEEGGAGLGSLLIVDVSSSTNPIEVGQFDTIGTAYKATVYGNYVYLADGAEGIIILDIGGITAASAEIGTLLANRIDTNVIYADTSYISSGLNVGQNAMIGGALTITGNASSSLLSTNTNPALLVSSGYVGIGTSSPSAKLSLDSRAFSGSGVVGIDQYLETENTVESAVQYGNRYYLNASNTATTTIVGSMLRIEDDTAFGNTVRGLEVQANKGINTTGENTALSGFARTFGVRGVTTGDAGGSFEPAGGFFESEGTSQGNAIRGYSDTITSASLLALFQDTSAFTGTGLEMNFGNTSGSFSSTSSKYLDFQNSGSSVFTVSAFGTTTIGDGTTSNLAGLQIGFGGICVDNDGSCTASTSGRITSVESQTGNSDLAEMYFSDEELDSGEIVVLENNLSVERATKESNTPILGVVSTKPGLTLGFDDESLNEGEKGYPIALSGRVPIKLSTENGPIVRGDYLMLSSLPGIAMKATGTGATIGISLEDFDDSRMYSDTFLNQFGDDMTDPVYEPVFTNTDPRINDGCYFGGGSEAGEEPCVPLTSTTSLGQIEEVNNILEQESVEEQLEELAEERSDTKYLADGQEVKVGQVVMFVQNGHRWLDSSMASAITSIVMTDTTGLEELAGVEEGRSAFKTVVDAIIGLWEKVKGIETRVDTLEAQNAELRAMILQLGGESASVEEPVDNGSDEETTEYEEEPVIVPPVETEETTSSSTEDTASTTPPVEEETTASSTDSGAEEVVEEVVTEETEPEVVEEEVVVESEPEPEVTEEVVEEPEVVEEEETEEPEPEVAEEVITEEPVVEPSPEPVPVE